MKSVFTFESDSQFSVLSLGGLCVHEAGLEGGCWEVVRHVGDIEATGADGVSHLVARLARVLASVAHPQTVEREFGRLAVEGRGNALRRHQLFSVSVTAINV